MQEPTYNPDCPLGNVTIAYQYKLSNSPGKTIVGLLVEFPPNAATPPHRHGGAAVSAYVLSGTLLNKMNDEPMQVISKGGSWYEAPGCHHRISANASKTEPATFFVTLVIETEKLEREGPGVLVQYDEEWVDVVARKMQQK
ncbi:hypothetical protein FE257_006071 [Aspergillus nanangensis]|uniref:Cupin type-2 domain-containing protein n=1 Tax=Aspergillus nanangensis TaxID=2582783 RepID=A0AAD4CRD3_ASPNN|nr:hypothetical protein FE257_006071 [Aspergillus nanangensis]